ncbi:MAG: hypothetical protein ACQRW7_10340 [Caulobacterales bacterium]|uniref:hypothetical protein n=1 Tax=Glycocaulis sp. TaxID=1969725 RepID=UPI003F9F50A7
MILRRLNEHVRSQNWLAVFLDFFIVVLGVFLAVQLANWNEAREARARFAFLQRELVAETEANLAAAIRFREAWSERLAGVRLVIDTLRECREGDEARADIERGLDLVRSWPVLQFNDTVLAQLTSDESLRARQSHEESTQLAGLKRFLDRMEQDAAFLSGRFSAHPIERHSLVGYGDRIPPAESYNNVDERLLVLTAPLSEVCSDADFARIFYEWERAGVFIAYQSERMVASLQQRLETMGAMP